jgi:hypothetical protein
MNEPADMSGPQFRAVRPEEQPAVRTTIVGGRPPGSGQGIGAIPRGIEVLVKKAAVDAEFRTLLLDRRAAAADQIGLTLEPAEAAMLKAVPRPQLEGVIDRTRVPQEHRRAFLGNVAAAMLAALGVSAAGCSPPIPKGIAPDMPATKGIQPDTPAPKDAQRDDLSAVTGIAPDVPPAQYPSQGGPTAGIAPDMPPLKESEQMLPRGIRPDLPSPKDTPGAPPDVPGGTGIRPDMP